MKTNRSFKFGALPVIIAGLLFSAQSQAVTYQIQRSVPTSAAGVSYIFRGFNDAGTTVGSIEYYLSSPTHSAAVRWAEGDAVPVELGNLYNQPNARGTAMAINNSGTIVGSSFVLVNDNGVFKEVATRWEPGNSSPISMGALGSSSGGSELSIPFYINAEGISVGFSDLWENDIGKGLRAVRWNTSATMPTNLGVFGANENGFSQSEAYCINSEGVAVGSSQTTENNLFQGSRATRWGVTDTTPTNLGTLSTDRSGFGGSQAVQINDSGVAVGFSYIFGIGYDEMSGEEFDSWLGPRSVRWGTGETTPTNLGTLGTDSNGYGYAIAKQINNVGIVIGDSELYDNGVYKGYRAVRWDANATMPTNLGTLGTDESGYGYSYASDINDSGIVVGQSVYYDLNPGFVDSRAVSWGMDGQIQDLNNLLSANDKANGWLLVSATHINNNGQILAWGKKQDVYHYAVLSPVNEDSDNDGVVDTIDNGAGSFADTHTPPTMGSIINNGGLNVLVSDAEDPAQGVIVTVGEGTGQAELSVCGFSELLSPGTTTTITCGSISQSVEQGSAQLLLDNGTVTITLSEGAVAKITQNPDGPFTVENLADNQAVAVTEDGNTVIIEADSPYVVGQLMTGYFHPVDMNGVYNVGKAGSTIPLKWQLTHVPDGSPVTDLESVTLEVQGVDCTLGAPLDQVEELASNAGGLQNLGDGNYQTNWKTSKSYAGTCKKLVIDFGGGYKAPEALFKFK
ncbi:MAG: PxKF domain-containing protein [Methylococcaceae bacterium]